MVGMVGTALSTTLKLELNKAKIGIHNNKHLTLSSLHTSFLHESFPPSFVCKVGLSTRLVLCESIGYKLNTPQKINLGLFSIIEK
jgi:hypothetical protein